MAAIELDTTELETLVEAGLSNRNTALDLLNMLRVANGKEPYANRTDAARPGSAAIESALDGVEADLGV